MNFITKKILAEAITRPEALEMLGDFRSKAEAGVFKKDGEKQDGITKDNIYEVFKEAEEEIKGRETLVVTLGVEFGKEDLQKIGEKIKGDFLLEFRYEPELLGGAKLAWKGQEKDYSLRKKLQEL
ncbi:MAG: F0F1 ATP synthase subunit delta [Patescibacteria group bacterium]